MRAYVYGEAKTPGREFDDYADAAGAAVVSIDMHRGNLVSSPECPYPAPRARDIVEPIDMFHERARALNVPIIHVDTILWPGRADDVKGISAAWRRNPIEAWTGSHATAPRQAAYAR